MDNGTWISGIIYLHEIDGGDCSEEVTELNQFTYGMLFPKIIIFGILGNIVNLIVLSRPLLQTIPYIFAKSRAVSDLLAILSFIPYLFQMTKTVGVWDNYPITFFYAKVQLSIMNSLLGTSALYVTAFSVERYLYISKPLEIHFNSKRRKKTLIAVVAIPLLTMLFYVPYCFSMDVTEYDYDIITGSYEYSISENEDTVKAPAFRFYILLMQSLFRIGPTLTVILLNISSFVKYRKILKNRLQLTKSDSTAHQRNEENRIMLLLVGTSLTFFVCNSPAAALSITITDKVKCKYGYQLFRAFANVLETSSCALPVVVYLVFSTDYRKAASSLIFKPVRVAPSDLNGFSI